MKKTRMKIFEELDVKPKNYYWGWCAKNDQLKIAVFTIWDDLMMEGNVWSLHDEHASYKGKGYYDQRKVLDLCLHKGYKAFGLIAIAENPRDSPRSIKSIYDNYLIKMQLKDEGDKILGIKKKEVSFLDFISNNRNLLSKDGLSDLANSPLGKEIPDRALKTNMTFKRDPKVRKHVIERAGGVCEYCGQAPFELAGGEFYLESHHIITLASEGKDTIENVIALCPNHHREAHYGKNAEELEKEFIAIVKNKHVN